MGLKPLNHLYSTNPFTKVNGNLYINSNFVGYLLPSALADGFYKFLLNTALATFLFVSVKRLIQKFKFLPAHFQFFNNFSCRMMKKPS
jgi:hypothetical protein